MTSAKSHEIQLSSSHPEINIWKLFYKKSSQDIAKYCPKQFATQKLTKGHRSCTGFPTMKTQKRDLQKHTPSLIKLTMQNFYNNSWRNSSKVLTNVDLKLQFPQVMIRNTHSILLSKDDLYVHEIHILQVELRASATLLPELQRKKNILDTVNVQCGRD